MQATEQYISSTFLRESPVPFYERYTSLLNWTNYRFAAFYAFFIFQNPLILLISYMFFSHHLAQNLAPTFTTIMIHIITTYSFYTSQHRNTTGAFYLHKMTSTFQSNPKLHRNVRNCCMKQIKRLIICDSFFFGKV